MEPIYQGKDLFAVVPNHLETGAQYDVAIYPNKVVLHYQKSLLPSYMANQQGIVGMVINKLFSSQMKKEEFTVLLTDIKKMELSTSNVMGITNKNLMLWNVEPSAATYENITLTINLKKDEEEIKSALAEIIKKVDFKEINV